MRGSPTGRRSAGLVLGGVLAGLALTGCTSAPEETASTPSASSQPVPTETPVPSAAPEETGPDEVSIDITIADGQVDPNGKKLNVNVGQPIVLYVTSDEDDEVHAHTSGDSYALDVKAGTKVRGEFTLTAPGSYEVESHQLGKTIVVLNAR